MRALMPPKVRLLSLQRVFLTAGLAAQIAFNENGKENSNPGITYKSVKECADREIARDLQMSVLNSIHPMVKAPMEFYKELAGIGFKSIPQMVMAAMGFGVDLDPGHVLDGAAAAKMAFATAAVDVQKGIYDGFWADADNMDCSSQQHFLMRTFCDLHCIRDSVKKGDKAILDSLSGVVDILNSNMKALFQHYMGGPDGPQGQRVLMQGVQMMTAGLAELEAVANGGALPSVERAGVRHLLAAFGSGLKSRTRKFLDTSFAGVNATEHLKALVDTANSLSAVVQVSGSQRLAPVEKSQQEVLEYAANANRVMRFKSKHLDWYRASSMHSKHLQNILLQQVASSTIFHGQDNLTPNQNYKQVKQHGQNHIKMNILERLEETMDKIGERMDTLNEKMDTLNDKIESREQREIGAMLQHVDGLWWKMRLEFDNYLDAAENQVKTFKETLKVLHSYVNACATNFAGLKRALSSWARVESHTHVVLQQVWTNTVPLWGELTASLRDTIYLSQFAEADVHALNIMDELGLTSKKTRQRFCAQSEKQNVAEKAVDAAIQNGVCGQMLRQVMTALGHLMMLKDRFVFAGLGRAPNVEIIMESAKEVERARLAVMEIKPALAKWVLKQVNEGVCA